VIWAEAEGCRLVSAAAPLTITEEEIDEALERIG
jgi:hypothetical protein